LIEQGSVEASEDGRVPFVRPGIQAIKQRQLKESQRADGVVKSGGEGEIEVRVVFVGGAANEVEITDNHPRKREERAKTLQFFKEDRREGVVRGCVDIRHDEGERRKGGRQGSREGEAVLAGGDQGEKLGIPGGEDATGAPNSVNRGIF
jgi:hypothetical protein